MPSISAETDENNNLSVLTEMKKTIEPSTTTITSSVMSTTITSSVMSVSLKRKRPPKIEIPSVLQEIQTDKIRSRDKIFKDESVGFDGSGFGVFSIKGKKKFMEDTHKMLPSLHGDSKKGFFGVYDGHGGRKAAEFVAENLHRNILGMLETCEGDLGKEEAVKAGYLKTDEEFMKQGLCSGTCCVTCLIEEKDIVVSNLGDCRAVLCRGGVAEAITKDHRAGQEDERNRIENKGGYVENHRGAWRVHGILSVSRSIGDVHLKDWVLAEPDTKILNLTPDMEFLILASDGLWENVGNQEAVDTAKRVRLVPNKLESKGDLWEENEDEFGNENTSPPTKAQRISLVKQQKTRGKFPSQENSNANYKKRPTWGGGLMAACKELVNLAVKRGSLDDITVMIIDLKHFLC